MNATMELVLRTAAIGFGATLAMDVWRFGLQKLFGINSLDLRLLGRWVGHLSGGRLFHAGIANSAPVAGELCLGWSAHYLIGLSFAALLPLLWGIEWLTAPSILPALSVGIATVLAPWLVMQPAMGIGFAAGRAPNPNAVRMRNLAIHTVYGMGLYAAALGIQRLAPLAA
ncbi:MAG: DUF2938 domain-containing protein [Spirochaetales bacterium]|nr:DUF2938 domain-containing protein [Leptospiraceae bacterium]MCP5481315.1 DUF2938 domain-containing protein [Spirochaetales bacterium]MCP5485751.1 DUF2938 domain-containing protein [Spirochaetales bacterium]